MTCARCNYDLAGLPADGVCPECSLPITTSAFGSPLILAEPRIIRRAIVGCALIIACVLGISAIAAALLLHEHSTAATNLLIQLTIHTLVAYFMLAPLLGIGICLATPRLHGSNRFARHNRNAFVIRLIAVALTVAGGAGMALTLSPQILGIKMPRILMIAYPLTLIGLPALFIANMLAFSKLAALLAKPTMASAYRNTAITIPILTLALAIVIIGFILPTIAWTIAAGAMILALRTHLKQRAAFEARECPNGQNARTKPMPVHTNQSRMDAISGQ